MDRVYIDAATEEDGYVYLYPGQAAYSLELMNRCARLVHLRSCCFPMRTCSIT